MIDLSLSKNFAPFDVDGRRRMNASQNTQAMYPECKFQACTAAMARKIIEAFHEKGRGRYGVDGAMAWVPMVWCAQNSLEYRVVKHPMGGWYVVYDGDPFEDDDPAPVEAGAGDPFGDSEVSDPLMDYYRQLYGEDLDEEDINQLARRLRV
jgi:hypothetical protein